MGCRVVGEPCSLIHGVLYGIRTLARARFDPRAWGLQHITNFIVSGIK